MTNDGRGMLAGLGSAKCCNFDDGPWRTGGEMRSGDGGIKSGGGGNE